MTRKMTLMALTALVLPGEPFHEPFHGPATASTTQRHDAPSRLRHPERLTTTAARPDSLRAQNRSVCRVMLCLGFGKDYRTCRIAGVVVAHIYPCIGMLAHDLPALREPAVEHFRSLW